LLRQQAPHRPAVGSLALIASARTHFLSFAAPPLPATPPHRHHPIQHVVVIFQKTALSSLLSARIRQRQHRGTRSTAGSRPRRRGLIAAASTAQPARNHRALLPPLRISDVAYVAEQDPTTPDEQKAFDHGLMGTSSRKTVGRYAIPPTGFAVRKGDGHELLRRTHDDLGQLWNYVATASR